jgi:hypothetical protein
MLLLTEDTVIVCMHELGHVSITARQSLVTIEGRRVLVDADPEGRPIYGCPNTGAAIKPCQQTQRVLTGYSPDLLRIDGRRACNDTLSGFTDGTPPGAVRYKVRAAGQTFVAED